MRRSDHLSDYATSTIRQGSKSFAGAARLFDPLTRDSVVKLYAWCRHCDDVIDGQTLGHGQETGDRSDGVLQIEQLRDMSRRACRGEVMVHDAFAGLRQVVERHRIPERYLQEHLSGFAMDVDPSMRYESIDDTLRYAGRVAGVVGVMMALIMGSRQAGGHPAEVADAVLDRACDLGVAFQLTNIARDIIEDANIGRVYLPAQWLREAGLPENDPFALTQLTNRKAVAAVAGRLLAMADDYYRSSLPGIAMLPMRSAWSVAAARDIYRHIGTTIRARGTAAWDRRVRTSRVDKLRFLARGGALALLSRVVPPRTLLGYSRTGNASR